MTTKADSDCIARAILAELNDEDHISGKRTQRWLANITGISYTTLRRKLLKRPDTLILSELIAISDALGIPLSSLISESHTDSKAA